MIKIFLIDFFTPYFDPQSSPCALIFVLIFCKFHIVIKTIIAIKNQYSDFNLLGSLALSASRQRNS